MDLGDVFGGDPNFDWLQPVSGDLTWLYGTLLGVGIFLLVAFFVINSFKVGTAGSDMGKASAALYGIKNNILGVALVLIGVPFLLAVIDLVITNT